MSKPDFEWWMMDLRTSHTPNEILGRTLADFYRARGTFTDTFRNLFTFLHPRDQDEVLESMDKELKRTTHG